jgi:ankyrin repeat protein
MPQASAPSGIDRGVEVDAKDITGTTPLLSAVKTSEPVELVELLVQHGANPNEQDNDGLSPFFAAALFSSFLRSSHGVRVPATNAFVRRRCGA